MRSKSLWKLLARGVLMPAVFVAGCPCKQTGEATSGTAEHAATLAAAQGAGIPAEESRAVGSNPRQPQRAGGGHDPATPAIDCPLHDQGIDSAHMRPFDEVEEYIKFLERS